MDEFVTSDACRGWVVGPCAGVRFAIMRAAARIIFMRAAARMFALHKAKIVKNDHFCQIFGKKPLSASLAA